ncbi:hypothetical protein H0X09_00395 [Candidatus Saccharibacteria bacterium]|nr:hypothetical protein [Candidatus Saccharibacteria bacterium]
MAPGDNQLLLVPKEKPIQAGPFKINYKGFWIVLLCFISFCAVFVSAAAGVVLYGLAFTGLAVVFFFLLIGIQPFERLQTTALAKSFRVGNHRTRNQLGHHRHSSIQPEVGEVFGLEMGKGKRPKPIKRIGRVDFIPYDTANAKGVLGVAFDHRFNTYSATLQANFSSMIGASKATRRERLGGYANLLDTMAEVGSMVDRFSWSDQTLIGEKQSPEQIVEAIRSGAGLTREHPPNQEVLLQRTEQMGENSVIHRTSMTLTIRAPAVKREARILGGVEEVLVQQAKAFYASATGRGVGHSPIGLKSASFLDYNQLVLENRLRLDPVFAQSVWQEWVGLEDTQTLLSEQIAWPGYADFEPTDHCKLGQTVHMGFYIAEFTRTGMQPDLFWEILKVPVPKTVTTVFDMLPPALARRHAEWSTTGATNVVVERAAKSRRVTATQHRAAEVADAHEWELAAHQGQVGRIRCYIDLTGETLDEVRSNAAQMRNAWADARFLVEPLEGRQHLGIHAVLPTGRGLVTLPFDNWL